MIFNFLYAAKINPKLYEGDITERNIYYTQMRQEIEHTIASDEPSIERLENEKNLLSKLQELIKYKPKKLTLDSDIMKESTLTEEEFLKFFNNVAQMFAKNTTIKRNQLIVQDKLAYLKHRIENLTASKKENLRLYQLQFAYYKLIQVRDKELSLEFVTLLENAKELIYLQVTRVLFDLKKHLLELNVLDEKILKLDTRLIALNLAKEREVLSSDTISTKLDLKLENNSKNKDKYLKNTFDVLLNMALYEYQQKSIDKLLSHKTVMKNILTKFSKEDKFYEAKYLLLNTLSSRELESIDFLDSLLFTLKEQSQIIYDDFTTYLKEPLFIYDENPILAISILKAIFIIFIGFIIARIYHRQFIKFHNRRKDMSVIFIKVIANLGFTVIFLIAFIIGISSMGLSLASFTVIAGALSIGIGFALRSIVSNYIAGIVIMSENNIKIGHFISVDNKAVGKVMDIGLRATVIATIDNTHYIIPNSDLIEKNILNLTLEDRIRRIYVPFKVAYGADIKKIRSLIVEAVKTSDIKILRDIHAKKPNIWVRNMGESFIELDLLVWVEGYRPSTKSNLLILIHETLLEHHIKMPYPQLDLHLKKSTSHQPNLEKNFLGSYIKNQKELRE
ncbi:MAG: Unknown protein [uncultured Sulfurovum sp.]|uniref:Mechanosensitive ion channel MscS domain-containing protein n=1 Tax=uncultured Sulfurovum sp. TaxID=269237 RepID=A0A6S6TUF5_9BACT|nr:MAG: Unknown protein [uncultured Sulfurovum sp.]